MDKYSVELRSVTKRFGDIVAVNDMDLNVAQDEFLTLLGPSGCGKTTTLRIIAGLEAPDQGEVLLDGKVVNDLPANLRGTNTVFQNLALFPHLTVKENIAFGLHCKKAPQSEIREKVDRVLNLVQLQGFGNRRPAQLSGGQQQRVALARSLVLEPVVLLLDEPLAALDRKLCEEMQVELCRIQEDVGITFIYVTHDQTMALSMSNKIALMKDGIIVQLGTPDNIYEAPKNRFAADFMGIANIFKSKSFDYQKSEKIEMQTEKGFRIVAPNREEIKGSAAAGLSLSVCIRPEAVKVLPLSAGESDENRYLGTVRDYIYKGESIELRVALKNGEIIVARLSKQEARAGWEEGKEVYVNLPFSSCIVLLED